MSRNLLRAGTRGSRLALVQTQSVVDSLTRLDPGLEIEIVPITTSGDMSAGAIGEGVFVAEIRAALLEGEIDLAVHSYKDLPTEPLSGLMVAATPPREDPREALVGGRLSDLPAGARVGTGSPRRSAQLKRARPDLRIVPIRGNVPTRVAKVDSGELEAVLVAAAGLRRLGLEAGETFDAAEFLPAPGQGALAVETREGGGTSDLLQSIDDHATRISVDAERAVLRRLGGGCLLPLGAWGRVAGDELLLDARVVSAGGEREARGGSAGESTAYSRVASEVASQLLANGAQDLL